jgi:hypothetical protein
MTAQHTRSKSLSSSGSSSPEITEDVCNCGQIVGKMWAKCGHAAGQPNRCRSDPEHEYVVDQCGLSDANVWPLEAQA